MNNPFYFRVIKYPLKPKISLKVTSVIICLLFLLSIGATLLVVARLTLVIDIHTSHFYDHIYDTYRLRSWLLLVVIWTAIFFATTFLPTAIMTAVYYSASVALTKSSAAMQSSMEWKKRIVRDRKVNRMFIVAVVCFCITVAPYTMYSVFISLFSKYNMLFIQVNRDVFHWLGFVFKTIMTFNCCINPVIYCKMHRDVVAFINKMLLAIKTAR